MTDPKKPADGPKKKKEAKPADEPGGLLSEEWDRSAGPETPVPEAVDEEKPRTEDIEALEGMFPGADASKITLGKRAETPDQIRALEEGKPPKPPGATDRFEDLPRDQTTKKKHFTSGGEGAGHQHHPLPIVQPPSEDTSAEIILDAPPQQETPPPLTGPTEVGPSLPVLTEKDFDISPQRREEGAGDTEEEAKRTRVEGESEEVDGPPRDPLSDSDYFPSVKGEPGTEKGGTLPFGRSPADQREGEPGEEEIPAVEPLPEEAPPPLAWPEPATKKAPSEDVTQEESASKGLADLGDDSEDLGEESGEAPPPPPTEQTEITEPAPAGTPEESVGRKVGAITEEKSKPSEKPFDIFAQATERGSALKGKSEAETEGDFEAEAGDDTVDESGLDEAGEAFDKALDKEFGPGPADEEAQTRDEPMFDGDEPPRRKRRSTTISTLRASSDESGSSDYLSAKKGRIRLTSGGIGVIAGALIGGGLVALLVNLGPLAGLAPDTESTESFDGEVRVAYKKGKDGNIESTIFLPGLGEPHYKLKVLIPVTDLPREEAVKFITDAFDRMNKLLVDYKNLETKLQSAKEDLNNAKNDIKTARELQPEDYKALEARIEKLEGQKQTLFRKIEDYSGANLTAELGTIENAITAIDIMDGTLDARRKAMSEYEKAQKKAEKALQNLAANISSTSDLGAYFKNGISKDMLYRFCEADVEVALRHYASMDYRVFQTVKGDRIRLVTTNGELYVLETPNLFKEAVQKARAHLLAMDKKLDDHVKKNKGLTMRFTGLDFYADVYKAVYAKSPNKEQAADMRRVMNEKMTPDQVKELVYDLEPGDEFTLELE
ncbi:MAG: hypothetical protein KAT43_03310 [Nanoarchaeota archaeon]|nr:hypothetical protein [Nanoarchaeota archaeon]